MRESAEAHAGAWLVRKVDRLSLTPEALADLRALDAYDGDLTTDLHGRVLLESWRRFGARPAPDAVQIWECVLIQNPVCAFIARFDEPPAALELGRRLGLGGFDGYVAFMRMRREIELDLLERLPLPTLVIPTSEGSRESTAARVRAFVSDHLDLDEPN